MAKLAEVTFTPRGNHKPRKVATMADVRQAVWVITDKHTGVFVKGPEVRQDGKLIGSLDGEVSGE